MRLPPTVFVAFALLVANSAAPRPALADDWPAPQTKSVFSASGEYFVRVIPGLSWGDTYGFAGAKKGPYAKAEFYGRQKDRSYKLLWESNLLNPVAPVDVFLSDRGVLITFDNWHNAGYGKVAIIYTPQGSVRRSYALSDLFSESQVEKIPQSVSSRHWRNTPIHFVDPRAQDHLYVPHALGGYFVFNLSTGDHERTENSGATP